MKLLFVSVLNRFPRLKAQLKLLKARFDRSASVSNDYIKIEESEREQESRRLSDSWKQIDLPLRQRSLADKQLRLYRDGAKIDVFDTFINALDSAHELSPTASMLEIGCSSAYYSEVLTIAGKKFNYTGCDYSEGFIELGRSLYPHLQLDVEDATHLGYESNSFDIVISGCCLLHIPDYATAIAETARVAKNFVLFHRTPVVYGQETQYYRKMAYGVETIEIHIAETEFMNLLVENELTLIKTLTLSDTPDPKDHLIGKASRTYLCRKNS